MGKEGPRSAKRECEDLDARIEKLDLELPIGDGLRLSDQLMQPLCGNRTIALLVHVDSVGSAGRMPIDEYPKSQ